MMCAKPTDPFEAWTKPAAEVFQFWISLWPVAPMFGVAWRFGQTNGSDPTPEFMKPFAAAFSAVPVPPAAAKPAPKPAPTATPTVVEAAASAIGVFEPIAPVAKTRKAKTAEAAEAVAAKAMPDPEPVSDAVTPPAPEAVAGVEPVAVVEPVTVPEPVAVVEPMPVAEPVAEAPTGPAKPATLMASPPDQPDDLKLLRGIGPGLEKQLNGLGVYTFAQLAGFSDGDLTWIDQNLTSFKGRWQRDDWVGQARALMG